MIYIVLGHVYRRFPACIKFDAGRDIRSNYEATYKMLYLHPSVNLHAGGWLQS